MGIEFPESTTGGRLYTYSGHKERHQVLTRIFGHSQSYLDRYCCNSCDGDNYAGSDLTFANAVSTMC